MAENSKIEWTRHTFNPWIGCSKVHAGCAHCYAEEMMDHRYGKAQWGPNGTRVRTSDANWRKPLAWNRAAEKAGERHRAFCASLADVFEDWGGPIVRSDGCKGFVREFEGELRWYWHSQPVDEEVTRNAGLRPAMMDDLRRDLFALIDETPHLDWLLLTKRPENVRRMWPGLVEAAPSNSPNWPGTLRRRDNVWIGTSVSDQETADKQIPELLKCRDLCPILFLSCEPLLGSIDLTLDGLACNPCPHCADKPHDYETNVVECRHCDCTGIGDELEIDWVIVGGESGHDARPLEIPWVESIVNQCETAKVAFFLKQLGRRPLYDFGLEGLDTLKLRDSKGGDWSEWPEDLRVREFPQVAVPG